MAANDNKRYYWLKLNKNFFKQHEIIIIEGMPNGKEYLILYLKLLAESVSHEGDLRFSGKIPYSDSMLATLTNTNIDIVRSALKIFSELHMIEIQDDGTIHMNETENMIGSETGNAARKREYRERLKGEEQKLLGDNDGTNGGHCPQEIRDKSIENRYIDKLINDKPRNAHEETSNFNLFPNSYEERQALKEELTNRNLDIAKFYLMHNLVKSYYFNRVFNLQECITLSDLLTNMDSKYDKKIVAKAWSYSVDKSSNSKNRVGYITSILEKNINVIIKNGQEDSEDAFDRFVANFK